MKGQEKHSRIASLCGTAMVLLLISGFVGSNVTAQSVDRSNYYTRGIGQYPGSPKENFSPSLVPDNTTYRNIALLRSAFASSSHDCIFWMGNWSCLQV